MSVERRTWLAPAAVALVALATLPWSVMPWYEAGDQTNDASIYIECARSMLRGEGYAYNGEPFAIRPPGFAAMIAPLLAWRGADFAALNLMVSMWGVLAVALLTAFARPRIGAWAAIALGLATWLNPQFQRWCNQTMSDVPGVALLFACLWIERSSARAPSARRDALLGLAIGLSTLVRTMSVLLVPAIVAARVLAELGERRHRSWLEFAKARAAWLALVAFATLAPWTVRNAMLDDSKPAEETNLRSYATGMWRSDPGDPASPRLAPSEVLARAGTRLGEVASVIGTRLRTDAGGATAIAIGSVLLVLALVGAVRSRRAADLWWIGYLGVLAFYFAFQERLALPIVLLSAVLALQALLELADRLGQRTKLAAIAAAALAALAWFDLDWRRDWKSIEARHERMTALASAWSAALPADAKLASLIGWHYAVYLDRRVSNLMFVIRREKKLRAIDGFLERRAIDAVILSPSAPADVPLIEHFKPKARATVVDDGVIFWVRS